MEGIFLIYGLICCLCLWNYFVSTKEGKGKVYTVACIVLIVLAVAQDVMTNPDLKTYCTEFAYITQMDIRQLLSHRWEFGYVITNKL